MSNSDPNQLKLDVDAAETVPEASEDSTRYKSRATGKEHTFEEIDGYSKTRPCSIGEAFAHFCIVAPYDEIGPDGDYIREASSPEKKKRSKMLVANDMGERTLHLLEAAEDYRKSVEEEKSVHDLYIKGDEEASDAALANQVVFKREGDQEFYRSWYADGLMKTKQDTISERQAAKEDQADFFDLSTNPDRTDELTTLIGSLTDQKNRAQAKKQ